MHPAGVLSTQPAAGQASPVAQLAEGLLGGEDAAILVLASERHLQPDGAESRRLSAGRPAGGMRLHSFLRVRSTTSEVMAPSPAHRSGYWAGLGRLAQRASTLPQARPRAAGPVVTAMASLASLAQQPPTSTSSASLSSCRPPVYTSSRPCSGQGKTGRMRGVHDWRAERVGSMRASWQELDDAGRWTKTLHATDGNICTQAQHSTML